MKLVLNLVADVIWLLHFFVVIIALFGWLIPEIWYVYIFVLTSVLISNIIFEYCFLSRWEFNLRRKINPMLEYDYAYTSYYTYNLTKGFLSKDFLRWAGLSFTSASLVINLYFALVF